MQSRTVPDGLAEYPPGPPLCARLAALDPARVANSDTVELLQAWRRLRSYVDAQELTLMAAVGRCDPAAAPGSVSRLTRPDPNCGIEIAAALTITENAAWREHSLAETLVHRLPAVHAALAAGSIDRARSWVFADHLAELTDARIDRICRDLLPHAPRLTTGQLRARLRRMLIAIDPDAARRRYQKALRERRVIAYLDAEGTATVSAIGLDPAAAQAACERVDALARELRAAGHPDSLSHIRVDLFCALLDGSLEGVSHDQIIATLLACADDRAADDRAAGDGHESGSRVPSTGAGEHGCSETSHEAGIGSDGREPGSVDPDNSDGDDDSGDGDGDGDSGDGDSGDGGGGGGGGPVAPGPSSPIGSAERARHGIEIRVRISTLLGRDEHPAEIAGLGPVLATTARAAVAGHRRAEWRFAITDSAGHLVLAGCTRHRPPQRSVDHRRPQKSQGGTVELQIPAGLLGELAVHPPVGWEPLIADLAGQYARRESLRAALDARPFTRCPHEALRRHVEIRDRTCRFPGCRRRARATQQDHTLAVQHGGRSVGDNLGALCVLHHALKTAGRWRLDQPVPGYFRWHSPLGRTYCTRGEPVCPPLPAPLPAEADRPGESIDPSRTEQPAPAQREIDDSPTFPTPPAPASASTGQPPDRAPPDPENDPLPF